MRTIAAVFALLGSLATAGSAVAQNPVPVIVSSGYAGGFSHCDQCEHVGYGSAQSAYAAGPCDAPPYDMEDIGRQCNHWRNSCCDNAWAGYCNETGLFGYRTTRDKCEPCGSHLFSLFRWSQPAADCAIDNCQPAPEVVPMPEPEVVPMPAPEAPAPTEA